MNVSQNPVTIWVPIASVDRVSAERNVWIQIPKDLLISRISRNVKQHACFCVFGFELSDKDGCCEIFNSQSEVVGRELATYQYAAIPLSAVSRHSSTKRSSTRVIF